MQGATQEVETQTDNRADGGAVSVSDAQLKAPILQYAEVKSDLEGRVATGGRLNTYASLTLTAGHHGAGRLFGEALAAHP